MGIKRKHKSRSLKYLTTPSSINPVSVNGVIGLSKYLWKVTNTVTGQSVYANNASSLSLLGIGNPGIDVFEIEYKFSNYNQVNTVSIANNTFSTIPDSVLQFNYDILSKCLNITSLYLTYGTSSFFSDKVNIDVSNRGELIQVHSNAGSSNGYGQLDQLQSLNVSGCTALTLLYLYSRNASSGNYSLTSLNLTGCTSLIDLIGQNVFGNFTLDVSTCTSLKSLNLRNTKINGINFGSITSVTSITFYQPYAGLSVSNRLDSLDLTSISGSLLSLELIAAYLYLPISNITGWNLLSNLDALNISVSGYEFRNNIGNPSTSFTNRNEPSLNLSYTNPKDIVLSGIGLLNPTYIADYNRLTKFVAQNQQIGFIAHWLSNFYSSSSLITELNLASCDIIDQDFTPFNNIPNVGACTIWLNNNNMTWSAIEFFIEYCIASNKTNITLNMGACTGFTTTGKAAQNSPLQDIFPSGYRYDLAKATLISRGWNIISSGIISDSFIGTDMTFLTNTSVNQKGNFIVYDNTNTPVSNTYTQSGDVVNLSTTGLSEIKYQAFDNARLSFGFSVTNMTKCIIRQGDMRNTDISNNLQLTEMWALGDTYSTAAFSYVGYFGIRNNPNLTTLYIRGVDMSGTQPSTAFYNFNSGNSLFDLSGNALSSTVINNVIQRFLNRGGGQYTTWNGTINLSGGTNGAADPSLVSALQTMYPLYTILTN